jgi:hypothetical protein
MVDCWPEHQVAVGVFSRLTTQWRVGFSGAVGLDYVALPTVFQLLGVSRTDWPQLFEDIRVMERGALHYMRALSAQ